MRAKTPFLRRTQKRTDENTQRTQSGRPSRSCKLLWLNSVEACGRAISPRRGGRSRHRRHTIRPCVRHLRHLHPLRMNSRQRRVIPLRGPRRPLARTPLPPPRAVAARTPRPPTVHWPPVPPRPPVSPGRREKASSRSGCSAAWTSTLACSSTRRRAARSRRETGGADSFVSNRSRGIRPCTIPSSRHLCKTYSARMCASRLGDWLQEEPLSNDGLRSRCATVLPDLTLLTL